MNGLGIVFRLVLNLVKLGTKVYVWGCQLVRGTVAASYYKTTDTISGPPRYSYDPDTLTPTGLYLEKAATNIIRTAQMISGGSDGIRINSSADQKNGLNADGVLSPMGTTKNVCKVFLDGTETSTTAFRLHNPANADYSTQNIHTSSLFIKPSYITTWRMAVSNNFASATDGGTHVFMTTDFTLTGDGSITNINAGLAAAGTPTIKKYPNGWYRISITYFRSNQTGSAVANRNAAALVYPIINNYIGTDSGGNVTSVYTKIPFTQAEVQASPITFGYLFGPQAEDGVLPTSYIPTSGNREATRSADIYASTATEVLDRANGTKPAFYTTDGLSIFTKFKLNHQRPKPITNNANLSTHSYKPLWQLATSTTNVEVTLMPDLNAANGTPRLVAYRNSDPKTMFAARQFTQDADVKSVLRYLPDDNSTGSVKNRLVTNDGTIVPNGNVDQNGHIPLKATRIYIGSSITGTVQTNGTISRLTFWKTPFEDHKLLSITA